MPDLPAKIDRAMAALRARSELEPEFGLILGTGLGPLAAALELEAEIPFADIPHLCPPTAESHAGKLLLGRLAGKAVAVFQGRLHLYEGFSPEEVAFPVRLLKALGARGAIITNIAGGINPLFGLGDIMVVADHLNLLGSNPLAGPNHAALGPRFPDMSQPYDRAWQRLALEAGARLGLRLQRGVYACMPGPSLETAAEYRMLRILGADAVGMSTVPEVIVAVHAGLKVLALSLITDLCLPDALEPIDVPRILSIAAGAEPRFAALLPELIAGM